MRHGLPAPDIPAVLDRQPRPPRQFAKTDVLDPWEHVAPKDRGIESLGVCGVPLELIAPSLALTRCDPLPYLWPDGLQPGRA